MVQASYISEILFTAKVNGQIPRFDELRLATTILLGYNEQKLIT